MIVPNLFSKKKNDKNIFAILTKLNYLSHYNDEKMNFFMNWYKPSEEYFKYYYKNNDYPDNYKEEIEKGELINFNDGYFFSERNEELAYNGNVYLITGSLSYSCGSVFSAMIKDNKIGILIGEPTGNASTFFAGGDITTVTLPNSVTTLNISCAMYVRTNEEARLKEPDAVYPDVYIPTTFEDYINGKDPCWEYLVENVFSKQED